MGGHVLVLVAVGDVAGAAGDDDLRGDETAFSLDFTGRADALPSALHELRHYDLGPFPLFLGPAGAASGLTQGYNAIVDRSVRVRTNAPAPAPTQHAAPAVLAPAEPQEDAAEPTPRDAEIIEERLQAVRAVHAGKRRRARRARHRLRRMHGDRVAFLRHRRRAARKRARNIRANWMRRHQP